MDKFETQFSDLDVQTSYMEGAMSSTTATTTPQDQVDLLINQVADEAGLEKQQELGNSVPEGTIKEQEAVVATPVGEEDGRLAQRLRALRVSSNGRVSDSAILVVGLMNSPVSLAACDIACFIVTAWNFDLLNLDTLSTSCMHQFAIYRAIRKG